MNNALKLFRQIAVMNRNLKKSWKVPCLPVSALLLSMVLGLSAKQVTAQAKIWQ